MRTNILRTKIFLCLPHPSLLIHLSFLNALLNSMAMSITLSMCSGYRTPLRVNRSRSPGLISQKIKAGLRADIGLSIFSTPAREMNLKSVPGRRILAGRRLCVHTKFPARQMARLLPKVRLNGSMWTWLLTDPFPSILKRKKVFSFERIMICATLLHNSHVNGSSAFTTPYLRAKVSYRPLLLPVLHRGLTYLSLACV